MVSRETVLQTRKRRQRFDTCCQDLICPRGTASGKRSQSIHAPTVCYWQIPAQVLSLIDEEGDEYLRSGHYRVEFGVEGSAEGIPAEAALDMRGDDVRIFAS